MLGDKPDELIRTPMPWDATAPVVGFTTGTPWEPANEGFDTANVTSESADPASLLSTYRDLIHLRATHPALAGTETVVLTTVDDPYLAQLRSNGDEVALVVTNFGPKPVTPTLDLSGAPCVRAGMAVEALFGTATVAPLDDPGAYAPVPELAPQQTIVIGLDGP